MAGALRKTMVYLGLAEDDDDYEYEDYDGYEGAEPEGSARDGRAAVTPMPHRPHLSRVSAGSTELARITTIHPRTYNEAKKIGEHFRDGTPVIMNLTDMDDADAKRLVDFAAGLVFGRHGSIERVTQKVFLLTPANVEITAEDKSRLAGAGFFNQS